MNVTLHSTPRWRDVMREQIRIVGLSLRREALVVAIVLGVGTLIIGNDIRRGGPGFDGAETFPTALLSFFFPFAIWRSEQRFGPGFLRTLPVERRRLALTKVFAGWVWLMAAMAVFVCWLLALGLLSGASPARTIMRLPVVATMATYMLGSALVLGLRHPLRWLLGTAGLLFLLGVFNDALGRNEAGEWRLLVWSDASRWLVYGPYGVRTLLSSSGFFVAADHAGRGWRTIPDLTRWVISASVWFGAGGAALWVALARHGERRRR